MFCRVAFCCVLVSWVAFCRVLLRLVAFCRVLLRLVAFSFVVLRLFVFCCVAFSCVLVAFSRGLFRFVLFCSVAFCCFVFCKHCRLKYQYLNSVFPHHRSDAIRHGCYWSIWSVYRFIFSGQEARAFRQLQRQNINIVQH